MIHLISVKTNKNEDGDGWWTCSYSKAKPNAPFAHPLLLHKRSGWQAFQHHSFIPGFASRLSTAQTKTRIPHADPLLSRAESESSATAPLLGTKFGACRRKGIITQVLLSLGLESLSQPELLGLSRLAGPGAGGTLGRKGMKEVTPL